MNLIDRYVAAVGKNLPSKGRADIEKEIRSTLEDMLEDRAAQAGRPADEAMQRELLKEYGAPDKVAAAYLPQRYLVGPRLYPIFILVLKIVFCVLTALGLVGLGLTLANRDLPAAEALATLGKTTLQYFGGLMQAFGNIVLIFAILERTLPKSEFEDEEHGWNPDVLEQEPGPDEVKPWEPILSILFTCAVLIVFNFYPQALGFNFLVDGRWVSVPALSEAFFRYMPWINLSCLISLGLNLYLLRQGRWQPVARWVELGQNLLDVAIAILMLRGPSLLGLDTAALAGTPLGVETGELLVMIFSRMIPFILIIIIVLNTIEIAQSLYRLLKPAK